MRKLLLLAGVALAGCAPNQGLFYDQTETVHLAVAGKPNVVCGPYQYNGAASLDAAQNSLRACVVDFQRQGYQRVQAPAK